MAARNADSLGTPPEYRPRKPRRSAPAASLGAPVGRRSSQLIEPLRPVPDRSIGEGRMPTRTSRYSSRPTPGRSIGEGNMPPRNLPLAPRFYVSPAAARSIGEGKMPVGRPHTETFAELRRKAREAARKRGLAAYNSSGRGVRST